MNTHEANLAYKRSQAALASGAWHAIRAGRLLAEARDETEGGRWRAWLVKNFDGTAAEAERSIRAAERWDRLPEKSKQSSSFVRGTLKILVGNADRAANPGQSPAEHLENSIVKQLRKSRREHELKLPVIRKLLRVAEHRIMQDGVA